MARGHNDYGVPDYSFFAVETPLSDVVAERQGFSRLDNRGRVFWFEDWRSGISRMAKDYSSAATQVQHKMTDSFGVGYYGYVELDPLAENGFAALYNDFMLPVSHKMGIEFGFYLSLLNAQLTVALEHNYNGTVRKSGTIKIQPNGAEIGIQALDDYHTIYTPTQAIYLQTRFVSVKIVIDISVGKYSHAMIGNTQYDLSDYTLLNGDAGLVGNTYLAISCDGTDPVNVEPVRIGYIVISGDEP